jgi:hypothetical protein
VTDEIKALMEQLPEPDFWLLSILKCEKACGYVVWTPTPPQGVSYQTHKLSILDAFQAGFRFLYTDCLNEWLVLGPMALAVVRTLPHFIEKAEPPHAGSKINFVGTLMNAKVYAYPTMPDAETFWMGRRDECALGSIQDQ